MIIYLLNNHEAILVNDNKEYITVTPKNIGILSIDGQAFTVGSADTPTPRIEGVGDVHATFTTADGIRYNVVSPRLENGIPVSRVDPFAGYIEARMYISRLEIKLEDTAEELRRLIGSIRHDALGFIINNEEE